MTVKERPLKECENPDCSVKFHPKGRQIYCQSSCNPGVSAHGRLRRYKRDWPELDPNRKQVKIIPSLLTNAQIAASKSSPYHLNQKL